MSLVQRFSLALMLVATAVLVTVLVAVNTPYLGLSLQWNTVENTANILDVRGRAADAGIRSGGALLAVAAADGQAAPIELQPADMIDEPDTLDYAAFDDFLDRMGRFHQLLESGPVTLTVLTAQGQEAITLEPASNRPVTALPFAFWFQLTCGIVICVIAAWVQCLTRGDPKVRFFALAGYGVGMAMFAAAVYSTRELALAASVQQALTILNNIGAMAFGIGMIGLFARYPKDLGISRWANAICAFFFLWVVATHLRLFPSVGLNGMTYFGILTEMIGIVCLIAVQYIATRGDAASRMALTWLGVSVILGAGAFVLLIAVPQLLDLDVVLPQGYAFGFFVLIYLGVALGLTRYRLFELDRWAFSIFTYVLAAFLFAAIDFALIASLALTPAVSLGVTAVLVGLLYLPVRNLLMTRYLSRRERNPAELYRASAEIALQPSPEQRAVRWRDALGDFFQPLHLQTEATGPERPTISGDGSVLEIPAYDWSPPLRLLHPMRGRTLFGRPHLELVEDFARLVAAAAEQRDAYDRGVKEERGRIGRDLHDSVGARLLSSLRATDDIDARQLVRNALGDIREIVGGLSDRRETLANILAELRSETMERFENGLAEWPLSEADEANIVLPYLTFRNFTSAHRELVTNAIKHAPGCKVLISTRIENNRLIHLVENDCPDAAARHARRAFSGNGLENIATRARQTGGSFDHAETPRGFRAILALPMAAAEAAA